MKPKAITDTKQSHIWLYENRYEKFIRATGGEKFYRPIMHRTHPMRQNRFARRRCKTATKAKAYGLRLMERYIRFVNCS